MYSKVMLVLGFVVVWTILSIVTQPGFDANLPSQLTFATKLADPTDQVNASSFHDAGYEDAWIQFVDEKERLVQVQAVDSRIVIVFRLKDKEDLARYPKSHITPVTPQCKRGGTDCDIGSQEKLYVGNLEVEPVAWKISGVNRKLKIQQK